MYRSTAAVVVLIPLSLCSPAVAQSSDGPIAPSLHKTLATYVATRAKPEQSPRPL